VVQRGQCTSKKSKLFNDKTASKDKKIDTCPLLVIFLDMPKGKGPNEQNTVSPGRNARPASNWQGRQ
jgi:hypothetical protein